MLDKVAVHTRRRAKDMDATRAATNVYNTNNPAIEYQFYNVCTNVHLEVFKLTLLEIFSRKHIRFPKPSAARHTLSLGLSLNVVVTQLRHILSF